MVPWVKSRRRSGRVRIAALIALCVFALCAPRPEPADRGPDVAHWRAAGHALATGPAALLAPVCRVGRAPLTAQVGMPLAGYGGPRRADAPHTFDVHAMQIGDGAESLWIIRLDTLIATDVLRTALEAALAPLGIHRFEIVVSHTHTGLGGTGRGLVPWAVLGDDPAAVRAMARAAAAATAAAKASAHRPLWTAETDAKSARSRGRTRRVVDARLYQVGCGDPRAAATDGGRFVFSAAHPTTDGPAHTPSADYFDHLPRETAFGAPIGYASMAGGETSLIRVAPPAPLGPSVRRLTHAVRHATPRFIRSRVRVSHTHIARPALRIPVAPGWALPAWLAEAALPSPAHTRVTALLSDALAWVFVPTELSSRASLELDPAMGDRMWLLTPFSRAYWGYALPADAHGQPAPEQILSLTGPQSYATHIALLRALDAASAAPQP